MERLIDLHNEVFDAVDRHMSWLLPLLARFIFAAVLLMYFWNSGLTKLGDGFFGFVQPSFGAYAQIFPKAVEAAEYDPANLTAFHWIVTVAGTWAEFILPALIIIGLATRLSALGMIGFIVVQSLTDLYAMAGLNTKRHWARGSTASLTGSFWINGRSGFSCCWFWLSKAQGFCQWITDCVRHLVTRNVTLSDRGSRPDCDKALLSQKGLFYVITPTQIDRFPVNNQRAFHHFRMGCQLICNGQTPVVLRHLFPGC